MNTKYLLVFLLVFGISLNSFCQKYSTKTGFIGFYSKTSLEDIKAENNQVFSVLDAPTHHMAFAVLLKGFIFPKELMQEHFNENYVESDKYPKATFSGVCSGDMDLSKEGTYQVVIKGELNLHGVTKPIETTAQLDVKKDHINGTSVFKVKPEDFNITIQVLSEIRLQVKST